MQSSQPNSFINTRNVLMSLESRLNCVVCKSLATSPVTLGGCEHIFCSVCCENYLGHCCPICDLPAHVKDAEVDRQLFNMATLCGRLRDILDDVNGKNTYKEDKTVDIYCTPNQITSKLVADSGTTDQQVLTNMKQKLTASETKKGKENGVVISKEPKRRRTDKGRSRSTPTPACDGSENAELPKDEELIKIGENMAEKMDVSMEVESNSDTLACNSRRRSRRSSLGESKTIPVRMNNSKITTEITHSNKKTLSEDIGQRLVESPEVPKSKKVSNKTTRQRKNNGTAGNGKESVSTKVNKSEKKQPESSVCDDSAEVEDSSNGRIPNSVRNKNKKAKTIAKAEVGANNELADVNTPILPDTTDGPEQQKHINHKGKRKLTPLKESSGRCEKSTPTANKKILKGEVKTPKLKTNMKDITSPGLNKKNAKGETLLHVAAIKNEVSKVEQLLKDGANPNVRDNAGWTPLHEACNHGYTEVARLLLDHGAMMNVPGFENDSPLHDAVSNYRIDCVRLLVSRGASVTSRNLHGLTPVDYAKSQEMKDALKTTVTKTLKTKEVIDVLEYQQPCLLGTGLSREEKSLLQKTTHQLKVKLSEEVTPEVTHIVTKCNSTGMGPRTTKVVQGILSGKWILGMEWLRMCKEMNSLVCEEAFEIPGLSMFPDCKSPNKGRMNRKQQLPGLFDGCWFYFNGDFEFSVPPKADLVATIKLGGGKILTREPKPGHLDKNMITVPYHAPQDSEIKDCCVFVVYVTGSKFKQIRTTYICSVPASWVIDSAATFTLLPLPNC